MDSMGLSELISPMVNYISISSSNAAGKTGEDANITSITVTFGKSQKGDIISGAKMATLSKELQAELKKDNTLGQKGVKSIVYTPVTQKDGTTIESTLVIKLDDSSLSSETNLTVPTKDENIKELAAKFSDVNKDSFNFSEFTQIKANVLKEGQISAIALRNSSLMNEVASTLKVPVNDIFQIRMIIDQDSSKKMSDKLQIFVILNSGLTFGTPGAVNNLELPESSPITVTVQKQNTFNGPSKTSANTLAFTLSPKTSKPAGSNK